MRQIITYTILHNTLKRDWTQRRYTMGRCQHPMTATNLFPAFTWVICRWPLLLNCHQSPTTITATDTVLFYFICFVFYLFLGLFSVGRALLLLKIHLHFFVASDGFISQQFHSRQCYTVIIPAVIRRLKSVHNSQIADRNYWLTHKHTNCQHDRTPQMHDTVLNTQPCPSVWLLLYMSLSLSS